MFDTIDTNGDGSIDYHEFMAAAANKEKMISEKNMKMLFDMIDSDGSGAINVEELKEAMHGCYSDENEEEIDWEEILA